MSVFLSSLSSVAVIVLIIALGYILRRNEWFADSFGGNISKLITKIALPASIFVSVMKYLSRSELLSLGKGPSTRQLRLPLTTWRPTSSSASSKLERAGAESS